ncbi:MULTISPECIES: helix-turn-helix domain-containing protein [Dickeya]|uniref:Transcriptional regulator, XRE family n=1 Tax=Dickeya chrysanthemi (strain Ech1591) TaxID=561229 RepID=C6CGV3_DICC1|nr:MULTISPECIES: helix-turn-helix transcriptional regulator [Dickeya]ACT06766.1 transcriptional regulator, XRE family [Dickeya chrysanthemi Ech1591]MBP2851791.1 helix-turn-helix transcriptional regulator [Dickeya oryzae]MCI4218210.1 helix-turn-helix domain-containing protein [Dickeya dianthicola]WKV50847.1 helix-turn-helix domain-containing protein [Dickeya fangzhongdai]WKV50866.1 helix-turn-helix domain-containing protein [Dickeya fangzhongdai]
MATLTQQQRHAMNTKDEPFFKELGARIAQARKELQLTQQQLAEQLGIAQQTMAHYEGGRLKVSASLLPQLATILNLSLDELLGLPARRTAKRGPASRLEQQIQIISQLPKTKQKFVTEMLDNVIGKTE